MFGESSTRPVLTSSKRESRGYYRTRQITSAVHNHIKKYGEHALLFKTPDGKIAVR